MIERYIFEAVVSEVSEHEEIASGHKDGEKVVLVMRKVGWYIGFSGMQFHVGEEKPNVAKGDIVRLTMDFSPGGKENARSISRTEDHHPS